MNEDTIRGMGTGELVRRLFNDLSSLVDRELDLARVEARADVIHVGRGAAVLGFGLLLLCSFVASLVVAAVFAAGGATLAADSTTAALVVAGVFLVLGLVVAAVGWRAIRVRPLERTRETVKEDVEWVRRRAS